MSSGAAVDNPIIAYARIGRATSQAGRLWDVLVLELEDGTEHRVKGIKAGQEGAIQTAIDASRSKTVPPENDLLQRCLAHRAYISDYDNRRLLTCHKSSELALKALASKSAIFEPDLETWQAGLGALEFEDAYHEYKQQSRKQWNLQFIQAERERIRPWVKERFSHPLTDEQLEAVVIDEDNQLVVAGAGTGKTTTVLARIAYLIEQRGVKPDRILSIAFNKDAAEHIREGLKGLGLPAGGSPKEGGVLASTYHALGGNIVGEVSDAVRKKISALDTDPAARAEFIHRSLVDLFRADATHAAVRDFLVYYSTPVDDARDYASIEAFVQSESGSNLRTLRDMQLVKSHGERLIANWLFLHGLDYEYERQFSFPKGNPSKQRYQPDFTITTPAGEIYIEYYGVDEAERTAPGIDRDGYLRTREWKRQIHKTHQTTCIELTYAQMKFGKLFSTLAHHLQEILKLPLALISRETSEKLLLETKDGEVSGAMEATIQLTGRFLTLYRSNLWSMADIERRLDGARGRAFLDVFRHVYAGYTRALESKDETDFAGLVAESVPLCRNWTRKFDHIIVDEFQDISRGREGLLRELLDSNPARRFFAVGDDWQSIYRFTGSDVSVMTQFKFGAMVRTDLRTSFRFNSQILDLSSRFIQKNPSQLRKDLRPRETSALPAIFVVGSAATAGSACVSAVNDYISRLRPAAPEVLFLSRYRAEADKMASLIPDQFPRGVSARALTVHASKGLEADCVVLAISGGRKGFPCSKEDDPLIRSLLTDPDEFSNAEERRLFYVALTRAKRCVYLVETSATRSTFVTEILSEIDGAGGRSVANLSGADSKLEFRCPMCRGRMISRVAKDATFWSCENSPACFFTAPQCGSCKAAPILPSCNASSNSECAACNYIGGATCPACKVGILVERRRRRDGASFWACSMFPKTSCQYTSNTPPLKQSGPPILK